MNMSSPGQSLRDLMLTALGMVALVALFVCGALWVGGEFTYEWISRLLLVSAGIIAGLGVLVLPRMWRATPLRLGTTVARNADRTRGCSGAVLLAIVVGALVALSSLFSWLAAH